MPGYNLDRMAVKVTGPDTLTVHLAIEKDGTVRRRSVLHARAVLTPRQRIGLRPVGVDRPAGS